MKGMDTKCCLRSWTVFGERLRLLLRSSVRGSTQWRYTSAECHMLAPSSAPLKHTHDTKRLTWMCIKAESRRPALNTHTATLTFLLNNGDSVGLRRAADSVCRTRIDEILRGFTLLRTWRTEHTQGYCQRLTSNTWPAQPVTPHQYQHTDTLLSWVEQRS